MGRIVTDRDRSAERAAQWALAHVKPDYCAWPAAAQERYRCAMADSDRLVVKKQLLAALFDIHEETSEDVLAAVRALSVNDSLCYHDAELLTSGIGDDFFWSLDVWNGTGRSVLDFETLYDFDVARWNREGAKRGYRGSLTDEWAALRIDGAFSRASLSMAAAYVSRFTHEVFSGRRSEFESSDGWPASNAKPISKRKAKRYALKLFDRFSDYLEQRRAALLTEFDENPRRAVYMFDTATAEYPDTHFVFSDQGVLKAIRFRHFVQDCRALIRDGSDLDSVIQRERSNASHFLEAAYRNIVRNP